MRSWLEDKVTQDLIAQVLTANDWKDFRTKKLGFPSIVRSSLENRFLVEMRRALSGTGESSEALDAARQIREAWQGVTKNADVIRKLHPTP